MRPLSLLLAFLAVLVLPLEASGAGRPRARRHVQEHPAGGGGGGGDVTSPADTAPLTMTPGAAQIALSWPAATDDTAVTNYRLVFAAGTTPPSAGCTDGSLLQSALTPRTFTHTSLTDQPYSYRVCAYDAALNVSPGLSGTQSPNDTTAPSDGAALSLTPGVLQIQTSWDAASDLRGVDHYRLVFLTAGSFPVTTCTNGAEIFNGAGTSFLHTSLTETTTYRYRVCAYDAAGNVSLGNTALDQPSDTTAPTDGAALTPTPGVLQIGLAWNAASDLRGVDHYRVVFLTGATPPASTCTTGTEIFSGAGVSTTHTSLLENTQYAYRVCAYDAAGNVSGGLTATSFPSDTTAPSDGALLTLTPGASQIGLSWNAASDNRAVDHYRAVVLSTGATPASTCTTGTEIFNGSGTTTTNTSLSEGTTYRYRVCAYDAAGNVSTGLTGTAQPADTTAPADGATLTLTQSASGQLGLSWSAASDASGVDHYVIRFATGTTAPANCAAGTQACSDTASTSCTHTGLTNFTEYAYRVCAVDAATNTSTGLSATDRSWADASSIRLNQGTTNEYLTVADNAALECAPTDKLTVWGWMRTLDISATDRMVIVKGSNVTDTWSIAQIANVAADTFSLRMAFNAIGNYCQFGAGTDDDLNNGWYFVFCSSDLTIVGTNDDKADCLIVPFGTQPSAFLTCTNGTAMGTQINDDAVPQNLGGLASTPLFPWIGYLDDWAYTCTGKEAVSVATCIASGGHPNDPRHCFPGGTTMHYWPIDGDTNPTFTDRGNGNNMTGQNTDSGDVDTTIPN